MENPATEGREDSSFGRERPEGAVLGGAPRPAVPARGGSGDRPSMTQTSMISFSLAASMSSTFFT